MAVRISVLGANNCATKFFTSKKEHKGLEAFLKGNVIPAIADPLSPQILPNSYPWCFVMSSEALKNKHYYIGAFMEKTEIPEDNSIYALYSCVSYEWLIRNLQSHFHIAFWESRILASFHRQDDNVPDSVLICEWVRSLQRSYSPFWEKLLLTESYKFRSKRDYLLSGYCDIDERMRRDNGVEIMPWKGWPDCIQTEGNYAWLWRQSRHGRVIDSRRISL